MGYLDDAEDADYEAGVMDSGRAELAAAVVGHRIVSVEDVERVASDWYYAKPGIKLTLDDGRAVYIADTDDCCAYTDHRDLKFLEGVDNAVTSVTTEGNFTRWFIYAGDVPVVEFGADWSPGNPYYYGFGFDIIVKEEA